MKTGITGATGQLGQLVVAQLLQRTEASQLVALVRNTEKAASLGIEARAFDYSQPDATALQGIDQLLLISGNEIGQRKTQHGNVIRAAQQAGVQLIVYTSLLHADTSRISLAEEHLATEQLLQASGIPHVLLRNGWYNENYANAIAGALHAGAIAGSSGDGKISSAARIDFAEAAAVVLTSTGHEGKVYELAGSSSYTLTELAAIVAEQAGKPVQYNNLPVADYAKLLSSFGLPEALAAIIAGWETGVAQNDLLDEQQQLAQLIGRPTTPIAETVREVLAGAAQ